ncbi:Transposon Tf2-9 polyprotein [Dictyocoela muelleri]|nr:Transposon Tf2-9 polyprotein [Dictyocoela muelleri]
MSNMDPDIILGIDFLSNNKAKINLETMSFELNKTEYALDKNKECDNIETKIEEKTKIYKQSDVTIPESCKKLLESNDQEISNVGLIPGIEHEISLTEEKIIQMNPFRLPLRVKEKTLSLVRTLIQDKIIQPSQSPFTSSAFPIVKKNGDIRLVVDYRHLNRITKKEPYIFPKIWDLLVQLKDSKIFSKLDLKSGYYQVAMKPTSRKYTAFWIENSKYEWLRMPFGLTNAPKTFQRAMDNLFSQFPFVKVYLDDIIIHSTDEELHKSHLETILNIINQNNIKINISKSEFFKRKIIFLGHTISESGIGIDNTLTKNLEIRKPKSKKHIQRLLGYFNYFKSFIPNFSQKTLYLTDLLRKEKKIKWEDWHIKKTNELINQIRNAPILKYPNPYYEFTLQTDASDRAIGSVLSQNDNPVAFYSHKFTPTEVKYTTMEKEALGILKSMEFFKPYIIGSKITVLTDNKNLLYNSDLSKRVQRWKLLLEEFNYELKRIEGRKNIIADSISRIVMIRTCQKQCYWDQIDDKKCLIKPKISQRTDKEDISYNHDTKNRLKIPEELLPYYINKLHEDLAHPGSRKLYLTINKYICSKNLKEHIEDLTASCYKCQIAKDIKMKLGKHFGYIYSEKPIEFISSDIFGPIKTKHFNTNIKNEYFYILTITDICSRFTRVFILKNIRTNTIIAKIKEWLSKYPKPSRFLSDLGRQYVSNEFENFLKNNEIIHVKTSPYNPTANSISERLNSTIANILRIYRGFSLSETIKKIEVNLNLTYHSIIKSSPSEIIYGYSFFDICRRNISHRINENKIREKAIKENDQNKKNGKRKDFKYQIGDKVLRKNFVNDKILDRYLGPFLVTEVNNERGNVWLREGRRIVRHNVKNLKPFRERGECHTPMTNKENSENIKKSQIINSVKIQNIKNQLWKFIENLNYKRKIGLDPHELSTKRSSSDETLCSAQ